MLGCLVGVLASETADPVVEPYLTLALDAAELWAPDASLLPLLHDAAWRLAAQPSRRAAALRVVARTAPDAAAVARLREAAGDDVDLQWRALVRTAELGGETDDDVARLLAADPDPEARVRPLAVQAARPDAAAKEAVWQSLAVERSVPVSLVATVTTAFWRPGQDALLAPYADRYLDLLPGLDRGGMIPSMVYSNRLFPLHGAGQGFLDRALALAPTAPVVVGKALREKSDLLRRVLLARSR